MPPVAFEQAFPSQPTTRGRPQYWNLCPTWAGVCLQGLLLHASAQEVLRDRSLQVGQVYLLLRFSSSLEGKNCIHMALVYSKFCSCFTEGLPFSSVTEPPPSRFLFVYCRFLLLGTIRTLLDGVQHTWISVVSEG